MFKTIVKAAAVISLACLPLLCRAMPPGTLLYRTSAGGRLFGYNSPDLLAVEQGIIKDVYAGHAAIYIGRLDGVDYVVEAAAGGIVKTPAKYFVNRADNETFLGARLPREASPVQQAKAVALAKSLADRQLAYDFDFREQKGPDSGDWTCVGLLEKIYESADIPNPNNLAALEYDPAYYAVDITSDGYDNSSIANADGDCFSRTKEFSKIARRPDLLVPAPELIGYDLGREYGGERYIFLPYTQFLQASLEPVAADIELATSFSSPAIRGSLNVKALALRWSLINNPLSSLRSIAASVKTAALKAAAGAKTLAQNLGQKIFGSDSGTELALIEQDLSKASSAAAKKTTASAAAKAGGAAASRVKVNKAGAGQGASQNNGIKPAADEQVSVPAATDSTAPPPAASSAAKTSNVASSKKTIVSVASQVPPEISKQSPTTAQSGNNTAAPVYYPPVIYTTVASPAVAASAAAPEAGPRLALINAVYATGNNDWLELFNPGDQDFDLAAAGYRLEKTKTAEDPGLLMRLGNTSDGAYPGGTTIKARDTYLIARATADDFYLSRADAIATRDDFSWTGQGYTLYLGTSAISSSLDSDIIDALGFGTATYFLGDAPAPELADYYFLQRQSNSEDNGSDFHLVPAPDPAAIAARAALLASSTAATASSTASSSEETATSTAPEETATSTPESDPPAEPAGLAVFNRIYATGDNDWVELINPTDYDLDLAAGDYRLEKTVTADDPGLLMRLGDPADGQYPGGTIIKAHDTYLIVRDEAGAYYKDQADAIATRDEFTWSGSGYTLYLGGGPISSSTDSNIIDAVGFGGDATYFLGSRPAREITDNYFLDRVAFDNDNYTDFILTPSADPAIVWTPDPPVETDSYLFVPPVPIVSAGLDQLWHFDECYGTGEWAVGRWDCARAVGATTGELSWPLAPAADLNSFSFSFYYRKDFLDYPRLKFSLSNEEADAVNLILEAGLITVEGLPNSEWRYYLDTKLDADWHQATLVINQAADYWAVFIDGREVIRESFLAHLPAMTRLTASGDGNALLIDELAIWRRPLPAAEILADYLAAAPYSPLATRPGQSAARLVHFWDFSEDEGSLAADSAGNAVLNVDPSAWVGRRHDNYAIRTIYKKVFTAELDPPLASRDLSLAFWWRNGVYPLDGHADIYLGGEGADQDKLFALLSNYFRLGYWFNGRYGVLAEGLNKYVPYDDAWHHFALVYDSYRYQLTFYVDGEEQASQPQIWLRDTDRLSRLQLTSDSDGAELDELRLYEGALSPAQVRDLYLSTK
ncbi:MAG: LamG-like jellyroll fold domain-containing protein [Patescibacteria group bacterium]